MHPFAVEDTPDCLYPTDIGVGIAEVENMSSGFSVIESRSFEVDPQRNHFNGTDTVVTGENDASNNETRRGSSADTRPSPNLIFVEQLTRTRNPSENDQHKVMEIVRLVLGRRLLAFAYDSSIVGLVNLVRPSPCAICSVLRKVVWVILLLSGVAVMIAQIQGRIDYFRTRPTTVKYQLMQSNALRFPTVTICMENRLRRQVVDEFGW